MHVSFKAAGSNGETGRTTVVQVREQVGKQVLGQDANVAFDMVIEDESGRDGRFVVPTPPLPLPMGMRQVDGWQRRHGHQLI